MEQNKKLVCTINKDSNHISNQDLATQNERTKILRKQRSPDWDIIIKLARKSAPNIQEFENWWGDNVYTYQITDESE